LQSVDTVASKAATKKPHSKEDESNDREILGCRESRQCLRNQSQTKGFALREKYQPDCQFVKQNALEQQANLLPHKF
jgi:hypothetical protein